MNSPLRVAATSSEEDLDPDRDIKQGSFNLSPIRRLKLFLVTSPFFQRFFSVGKGSSTGSYQSLPPPLIKKLHYNIRISYLTALLIYLSSATLIPSLWPYIESVRLSSIEKTPK